MVGINILNGYTVPCHTEFGYKIPEYLRKIPRYEHINVNKAVYDLEVKHPIHVKEKN